MAIDTSRFGFVVLPESTELLWVDLNSMSLLGNMSYAQETLPPFIDPSNSGLLPLIGGWGISVDSSNHLLYLGHNSGFDGTLVGLFRQFNISNLNNVVERTYIENSAYPVMIDSVVTEDHRAWFIDTGNGWVGSVSPSDLSFGSKYSMPSDREVFSFEYIPSDHSIIFISNGNSGFPGRIFRVCYFEESPDFIHEVAEWAPPTDYSGIAGSHWDESSRTLYVIGDHVYAHTFGPSDCSFPGAVLSPPAWEGCGYCTTSANNGLPSRRYERYARRSKTEL